LGLPPDETLPRSLVPQLIADHENIKQLIAKFSLASSAVILCPGAEFGPAKQWPATQYAHIADHYIDKGREVWILGSPKDKGVAHEILQLSAGGIRDLTGATNLVDAIDLLSMAELVVCNDSGLMHVACALNRKVVAVFGSTSPNFTPPLNAESRVVQRQLPCSPCFQRECPLGHLDCLRGLPPVEVINAATDLGVCS
jgi:heptosyltransferase-2